MTLFCYKSGPKVLNGHVAHNTVITCHKSVTSQRWWIKPIMTVLSATLVFQSLGPKILDSSDVSDWQVMGCLYSAGRTRCSTSTSKRPQIWASTRRTPTLTDPGCAEQGLKPMCINPLNRCGTAFLFVWHAFATWPWSHSVSTRDVHRRGLRLLGQLPVCPPRLKLPLRRKYIYFF